MLGKVVHSTKRILFFRFTTFSLFHSIKSSFQLHQQIVLFLQVFFFYESPLLAVWRRGLTLLSCRRRAESRSPDRHHHPQTHPGKDIGSPAPNQSAEARGAKHPLCFLPDSKAEVLPPPPTPPLLTPGEQRDVGLHGDDHHVSSIRQTRTPEKAAGA